MAIMAITTRSSINVKPSCRHPVSPFAARHRRTLNPPACFGPRRRAGSIRRAPAKREHARSKPASVAIVSCRRRQSASRSAEKQSWHIQQGFHGDFTQVCLGSARPILVGEHVRYVRRGTEHLRFLVIEPQSAAHQGRRVRGPGLQNRRVGRVPSRGVLLHIRHCQSTNNSEIHGAGKAGNRSAICACPGEWRFIDWSTRCIRSSIAGWTQKWTTALGSEGQSRYKWFALSVHP